MPPFGFSIGGFIAATNTVLKLAHSLSETQGSSASHKSLMKELYAFHHAPMEVESLIKSSKLSESVANSLFVMVTNCREPIGKFLVDIDRYRRALRTKGSEK